MMLSVFKSASHSANIEVESSPLQSHKWVQGSLLLSIISGDSLNPASQFFNAPSAHHSSVPKAQEK